MLVTVYTHLKNGGSYKSGPMIYMNFQPLLWTESVHTPWSSLDQVICKYVIDGSTEKKLQI